MLVNPGLPPEVWPGEMFADTVIFTYEGGLPPEVWPGEMFVN